MPNNLQSYQIIFCMGFSCFLGTFLAYTANTFYQKYPKSARFDYQEIRGNLIGSLAMGILAGCAALAIGSVDFGYLENYSLTNIFLYVFFLSFFSGASYTLLGLIKLILSKVMPSNKTN